MKRIKDSTYTEAHTRPWLSGLERDSVKMAKSGYLTRDIHRGRIYLEQISALEVCLNECGAQRRNQVQGRDEGENGEPEGGVEGWDRWHWIEEGSEDEPERGWDQDPQEEEPGERARLWTVDHELFSEIASGTGEHVAGEGIRGHVTWDRAKGASALPDDHVHIGPVSPSMLLHPSAD